LVNFFATYGCTTIKVTISMACDVVFGKSSFQRTVMTLSMEQMILKMRMIFLSSPLRLLMVRQRHNRKDGPDRRKRVSRLGCLDEDLNSRIQVADRIATQVVIQIVRLIH
jgi:hypothetical protein